MKYVVVSSIVAIALFSGCGSSSSNPQDVLIKSRSVNFITDSAGRSLYSFDKDTLGVSNCAAGPCLNDWPVYFNQSDNDNAISLLPTITSNDPINVNQTTYQKHPLYYFDEDLAAGNTNGDWVKNVWHLVYTAIPAGSTGLLLSPTTKTQSYLSDSKGMSLYTFDNDTDNVSNCTEVNDCITTWPVYNMGTTNAVLPVGTSNSDFSTITRADGSLQSTYKNKPLYYFKNDAKSGDTNGDWLKGIWHLVEINPATLK